MTGPRVLVVDDEPAMHRFLRPALEVAGFQYDGVHNGAEALRRVAGKAPDAVLLDLGLPDIDGQDVLMRLREFSAVPVIVISARDREADKIAALDGGADDYLDKPFGVGELLARIRTALRHRRAQEGVPEQYRAMGVTLNFENRRVMCQNTLVPLTPREHSLFELLARNAGKVMTHTQLLTAVWGPANAHDVQYLRVYVGLLRQKLAPVGAKLIATEPGVGYRLAEPDTA